MSTPFDETFLQTFSKRMWCHRHLAFEAHIRHAKRFWLAVRLKSTTMSHIIRLEPMMTDRHPCFEAWTSDQLAGRQWRSSGHEADPLTRGGD